MTSQGHAYNIFRRALARSDLAAVRAAAAELPEVGLEDAFAILLLVRDREPTRYARAALRWQARFCAERPEVGLEDGAALLAGLQGLAGADPTSAGRLVREVCARHGVRSARLP